MKKITLLLALFIATIGFSQTELLTNGDFSNDKDSWSGSDFTVVSGEAFFASTNAGGNPWDTQLVQGSLSFNNAQEYVLTFKARSTVGRKITVAIQNVGAWDDQFRQDFDITATMATYTATFNAKATNANVQLGFLMAGFGNTEGVYYDDISLTTTGSTGGGGGGGSATEPSDAPSTPPSRNSADVISLYGDSYGAAAGFNGVDWDNGATATEGSYAGNNALKITNGSGDFIGFDIANTAGFVDATNMTHVHADFWISGDYVAGQVLKVKLSNHANGAEVNAIIKEVVPAASDKESWVSLDVEMGADNRDNIKQVLLIYTNSAGAPSTLYADNIYMYRVATASVENNELLGFRMYPNPANNILNISAKETIKSADIFNVLGKRVMSVTINKTNDAINVSDLASGIYLIKYTVNDKVGTAKFIKQ